MDYGDHRLRTISLSTDIPSLPKRRCITKDVFFNRFNKVTLSEKKSKSTFQNTYTKDSFDTKYAMFISKIKELCETHFKKRKSMHRPTVLRWNEALREQR